MATSETRIAIIAALEREVRPLVKGWRRSRREHEGRWFTIFESDGTVLLCAGIGSAAARRAAEAAMRMYAPGSLVSIGLAGALRPELEVGTLIMPGVVIDACDGSRAQSAAGNHVLVTFGA